MLDLHGPDQGRGLTEEPSLTLDMDASSTPSIPAKRLQEFFIPVHGLIRLTHSELQVVDQPAFQRLGGIYQLGQTWTVYRGATHKRIEHALGTLHVAHLIIEALQSNCRVSDSESRAKVGSWALGPALSEMETAFTRLGALVHDIGHLPAGHTLEDELGLLEAHDADERLLLVLDRRAWFGEDVTSTLRDVIDAEYGSMIAAAGILRANGSPATATDIVLELISKDRAKSTLQGNEALRIAVCRDIIGNTICADLLDYLHRDWLHLGRPRTFDLRLLDYMEIRTKTLQGRSDARLVINVRGADRLRTDAVTAILDLLESRYQLAEMALFHRTKTCAAAMLERALAELGALSPDGGKTMLKSLPESLLELSDEEMLGHIDSLLSKLQKGRSGLDSLRVAGARALIRGLRMRRLHKAFYVGDEYALAHDALHVQELYSGAGSGAQGPSNDEDDADDAKTVRRSMARTAATNRLLAMRSLEADFGMAAGSLVMYCPPRRMSTKIARVQILVHQDVFRLDEFEENEGDFGITGGHLEAQKKRFRRLWRVVIAIDPAERDRLREAGLLQQLERAIEWCVLGKVPHAETPDRAILDLARELSQKKGSPLFGRPIAGAAQIAAQGSPITNYPTGRPSLLACLAT